jgi:hypothetical protein
MQLPESPWLEENGTTEDADQGSDGEDESPENNEENNEENSPDERRSRSPTRPLPSPSPSPVQSPRVSRRRARSPTPEADRSGHPDYSRVLGAAMDAILTGDASEEDYARAASAAVLIPMLGQQERLNGADLSFVQTAIDASRRAAANKRPRHE